MGEPPVPHDTAVETSNPDLFDQVTQRLAKGDRAGVVRLLLADRNTDLSFLLAELSPEQREELLLQAPADESADLLERIEPEDAAEALAAVAPHSATELLDELQVDAAVEVLEEMDEEQALTLAAGMEDSAEVAGILETYDEGTAGRLMTPVPLRLQASQTAAEAIAGIRATAAATPGVITYLYVVDAHDHLVGVAGIRELVIADAADPLHRLMARNPVAVRTSTPSEECLRLFRRHRYLGLPVITDDGVLAGIIRADRLARLSDKKASGDLLGIFGAGDARAADSVVSTARNRLPWLLANLGTAFLAAVVVAVFQDTVAAIVALAVFLPVIAGQAGNAGVQTVTVLVEMLATTETDSVVVRRVLRRELKAAVLHGLVIGLIVGVAAGAFAQSVLFGAIVAAGMLIAMLVAGAAGALIPLGLRRIGQDPALGSGVLVTTVTDVVGFLALLGLAAVLLVGR